MDSNGNTTSSNFETTQMTMEITAPQVETNDKPHRTNTIRSGGNLYKNWDAMDGALHGRTD